MSIRAKIDSLIQSNVVNGVELVIQQDGSFLFNFVSIKKSKNSLDIYKSKYGITTIDELKLSLDFKLPYVLVINGKGLITKKVLLKSEDSDKTILNKVLPNVNESDFSYQKNKIHDDSFYVSIIRKDLLSEILTQLKEAGLISLLNCFLGPIVYNNCFKILEPIENIQFLHYNFRLIENQIYSYEFLEEKSNLKNIIINDESLSVELMASFAAGVSCFLSSEQGVVNSFELNEIIANSVEKKKFEFRLYALLFGTFILLLGNYLLFNHYWSKNSELIAKLEANTSSLKTLDTLKNELNQKKIFLAQNGMLEPSMTSFYADQIAKTLPSSLKLTELTIHPVKKTNPHEQSELIFFENNQLLIVGNCKNSTDVNEWMKILKSETWVSTIELINYKQDNAKEVGVFTLQITVV